MLGKFGCVRDLLAAHVDTVIASIGKDAAGRQIGQVGNFAGNGRQRARGLGDARRVAFEQLDRVGMCGPVKDIANSAPFDNFTAIHDDDEIAQLGNDAEMV